MRSRIGLDLEFKHARFAGLRGSYGSCPPIVSECGFPFPEGHWANSAQCTVSVQESATAPAVSSFLCGSEQRLSSAQRGVATSKRPGRWQHPVAYMAFDVTGT
eukprot:symbB.v1.2.040515.t1/scaffold7295.1/size12080/1